MNPHRGNRRWTRPDPTTSWGAVFYGVIASLIVWLTVDFLPHHLLLTIAWK
ncbi:hypothetical protein [Actinomadura logoneensis]|uniref:hypothetical protein n=1 Tax=Actinomadura logoneensis TaxID=2293572 RepID=UPI0013148179|nr:hypothetical protein [Actinomadura logoneensis]